MEVLEQSVVRLLDKVENRYYGKYTAFVTDNSDPENRGRLRLQIPAVLGSVVSGWALPCAPFGGVAGQGIFFVPDVGAGVWVEFEGGDPAYPIWVGTFWSKPGGTTEVPPPADSQSPPTSKIIATQNHTIELADADGSEAIIITDTKNNNKVTLDKDGIAVQDHNGNKVTLDSDGIAIQDHNGNKVTLDSDGIAIQDQDQNGNKVVLTKDGTKIEDKNANSVMLETSSITIEGNKIKIGANASSEVLIKGQTLVQLLTTLETNLIAHTHIGNLGAPTSPPTPPLPPSAWNTAQSTKTFVE